MTQTMTAAEAKSRFDEVTSRVHDTKERVIIQLPGGGTIAIVPSQDDESAPSPARSSAQDARAALEASRAAFRPFRDRGVRLNAAELIREGRDDEDDYRAWQPDAVSGR